jgi:methionine biosynthesis protein MetW
VTWPDVEDPSTGEVVLRADLALVAEQIPAGSRVLDLGCGSGSLLRYLITHKNCSGTGVDSDDRQVLRAIRRGIPVIDLDIESGLPDFADDSYDTVVMSRTLQAIRHPRRLLEEMGRVGHRVIVSVPNFGLWRNRLAIVRGHMPISKDLPHTWYDSPNVRYTTLSDLEKFFADYGFEIESRIPLVESWRPLNRGARFANLLAGSAVYVLRRRG